MILFFIGVIEMVIVTIWTKVVTRSQILASGVVTMINVLIWYYVLQRMVNDISNWKLAVVYALGCAVGTVISTYVYQKSEEQEVSEAIEPENLVPTDSNASRLVN